MPNETRSADQEIEDLRRMARESSEFYQDLANALDTLAARMLSGKSPDGSSAVLEERLADALLPNGNFFRPKRGELH
jgi:hypothetical protein